MSKPQSIVSERIKMLYEHFGDGNLSAFARQLDVVAQTLRDLMRGEKGGPSWPVLQNILRAFPDVSDTWLLRGEGEMLKSALPKAEVPETLPYMRAELGTLPLEPPKRVQPTAGLRVLTVQVRSDGDENIEVVPIWAAAGYPQQRIQQEYIRKLPSFRLPGAAFNNGSFRCFPVSGRSMEGTLQDGDFIICRYVEQWANDILDNRVYVVISEKDILVKRVLNQLNERGRLTLHSDNPSFDVQEMDGADVREVWLGIARITLDLTNTRLDVPVELARLQAVTVEVLRRLDKLESS